LKITSNALVTLVTAEQDCFKELFEAVDITRRISWVHLAVSSRPSEQQPEKSDDRMCWVDSEAQWLLSAVTAWYVNGALETTVWSLKTRRIEREHVLGRGSDDRQSWPTFVGVV